MTKEEAIKSLSNTKVYTNGRSEKIQEKLFELGFAWNGHKEIRDDYLLFMHDDLSLSFTNDLRFFIENSSYRVITADYILNLKWDEEKKDKDREDWEKQFGEHVQNKLSEYRDMIRAMTQLLIDESNRIFEQIKKDETDYKENKRFREMAGDTYKAYTINGAMIVEDIKNLIKLNKGIICINVPKSVEIPKSKTASDLKPFEKCLVCSGREGDVWEPEIYGCKKSNNCHHIVGRVITSHCIPYNEALVGKPYNNEDEK